MDKQVMEQDLMPDTIILMREERDCHNPVIAMACGVDYDTASKATGHKDLPGLLESPVFSNPLNLYKALIKLGFWKRNLTWQDLQCGQFSAGKTIVLVHNPANPTLAQHWVLLGHSDSFGYRVFWGDKPEPRLISKAELQVLFLAGWPNCAFEVYKASAWKILLEKIKLLF